MLQGLSPRLLSHLPSQCRVCHAWPSRVVCEACVERFAQPQRRCRFCALALTGSAEICAACLQSPPPLDGCLAAVSYAFPWSQLIRDFKFHEQAGLSRALAELMLATPWVEPQLEQAQWLIPIPLSNSSLRQRGYNQAALLARSLCHDKVLPVALLRAQATPTQHTLSRAQRLKAQSDAFTVPEDYRHQLSGSSVVLVDDVMTTGATLQAAALALRKAGVARVSAVVLARTEPS